MNSDGPPESGRRAMNAGSVSSRDFGSVSPIRSFGAGRSSMGSTRFQVAL